MTDRRTFLKTAGWVALGSAAGLTIARCKGKADTIAAPHINHGTGARMKLRFFPYELQLKHVFTVSSYSRTTTPDVQV